MDSRHGIILSLSISLLSLPLHLSPKGRHSCSSLAAGPVVSVVGRVLHQRQRRSRHSVASRDVAVVIPATPPRPPPPPAHLHLSPLPPGLLHLRVPSAARARTHFVDLSLHNSCSSPLRKASIQLTAPSTSLIPKARRGSRRQKWKAGNRKRKEKERNLTSTFETISERKIQIVS